MSTEYLCIYLCLIQFFLTTSYSFQCTSLSPPSLDLFLGILFLYFGVENGIVFLVSFSAISLLAYKNATAFCMLILYPEILLYLSITSISVLMESLGFSVGLCLSL